MDRAWCGGVVVVLGGVCIAAGLVLGGCVAHESRTVADDGRGSRPRTVAAASERERADLIDRVKSLASGGGEWEMEDEPGTVASVFAVSSNGSVVREIMQPGRPHEMTNVYHMDGPDLVMTHYCAAGNQPRMRAHADGDPDRIVFEPSGVTNLHSADEKHMATVTLVFLGQDRVRQEWRSMESGKVSDDAVVFTLRRKKG